MVTRSLVIDFIRYLRNKENVIIDPYITRTMFKSNVDRTDTVIELLNKIKKADDEFVAYGIIARSICHSANTNWKLCPNISYHEDLYEYLLEIGYEDEEATFYTKVVAGGNYKDYIRQKAKSIIGAFTSINATAQITQSKLKKVNRLEQIMLA